MTNESTEPFSRSSHGSASVVFRTEQGRSSCCPTTVQESERESERVRRQCTLHVSVSMILCPYQPDDRSFVHSFCYTNTQCFLPELHADNRDKVTKSCSDKVLNEGFELYERSVKSFFGRTTVTEAHNRFATLVQKDTH